MSARFPFPIPDGWFGVAWSDELAAGELKPIRVFGADWVLFRTSAGEVGMMDAYCPHLGAHLGHGGCVDGDAVRCPFHGWKWTRDGGCAGIPYAKRVPPGLSIRTLPVC